MSAAAVVFLCIRGNLSFQVARAFRRGTCAFTTTSDSHQSFSRSKLISCGSDCGKESESTIALRCTFTAFNAIIEQQIDSEHFHWNPNDVAIDKTDLEFPILKCEM